MTLGKRIDVGKDIDIVPETKAKCVIYIEKEILFQMSIRLFVLVPFRSEKIEWKK